nr:replication-associated recombination protein A [Candidatus Phycosocius spiralis]
MRPKSLDEVVGQAHLLNPQGAIGRMIGQKRLSSMILWGPPGVGKTSIARLLADASDLEFNSLSAVFSGVADLRKAFEAAAHLRTTGRGTLLFVDEIHRFNRAQQDGFLPYVEAGIVTLVGATTQNPSFELNNALLSRTRVFVLKRLETDGLTELLRRVEAFYGRAVPVTDEACTLLMDFADGDGRHFLTLLEEVFALPIDTLMDREALAQFLQRRAPAYDKNKDEHYNLISALHKSVRASDPDASLYWLARMLQGGEDPLFIARRLVRMASEDIGLADPTALRVVMAARDAFMFLGPPEGELALAQATLHLACAPKSNAIYIAFKKAQALATRTAELPPPARFLNAPTKFMQDQGYGVGYLYDPDVQGGVSGQSGFPDTIGPQDLYTPTEHGAEARILEKLASWRALRRG